jgi:hypothetical protein
MERLPDELVEEYRPATAYDIRSWSFGHLKAPRDPSASHWTQKRGTLDDEAIFGPLRDHRCACGKYDGLTYRHMICDRCGVKIASPAIRRTRFAHVELAQPVPHPLLAPPASLVALPILPVAYWGSPSGAPLASAYDEALRANGERDPRQISEAVERAFGVLLPVFEVAHAWGLQDTRVLAHGLALVDRREDEYEPES